MITFEQFIVEHNAPGIFKMPSRPVCNNLRLDFKGDNPPIIESVEELQDYLYLQTKDLDLTSCCFVIWKEYKAYASNYAWHQRAVSSNGNGKHG